MRGLLLVGLLLASLLGCSQGENLKFDYTKAIIEKPVNMGDTTIINYPFTNGANIPLVITEVLPQCGCTTGRYTKITKRNGKGSVSLVFVPTKSMEGMKIRRTAHVITSQGERELIFLIEVAQPVPFL